MRTIIHQVTDPHIPIEGDMSVRESFQKLMAYSAECRPDFLALTGDLPKDDGNREAYEWIHASLPTDVPVVVIPGNHDDPQALFEVFADEYNKNADFVEKIELGEIDLLFVNTESGKLPEDQLRRISAPDIRPGSVLFIHHPTKIISGGYMDRKYALLNRADADKTIGTSNIEHVFCGHFHTEFEIHDDYHLYVTPSPAFELDRDSIEARIGPPRIPLREIVIDGATVTSRMIYLDDL